MDGVIADFVGGICKAHGRATPYKNNPAAYGIFDMEKLWGVSSREFWRAAEYPGFWALLDKTPEADEIVSAVLAAFGKDNVAILTAPCEYKECIPEKKDWIRRYYPELSGNMLFGSAKRFLAGPNKVLIDDRDKNIKDFRDAGGAGIIVPRPWNSEWGDRWDVAGYVEEHLDKWLEFYNGTQD
jgi:5'(3')-deoxyribonucleotidase